MPSKLPEGVQIQVSRRSLPSDYEMPTMAMSVDHYSVGFLVSGDRRTITPQQTYDAHAGDVTVMPPYLYHRTISLSSAPYESYLIKFTQQAVEPLVRTTAPGFLEDMMERKIHHFPESARARIASRGNSSASVAPSATGMSGTSMRAFWRSASVVCPAPPTIA